MHLPERKSPRIESFDYSSVNYYFVTICTYEKNCIFGKPGNMNEMGMVADCYLREIPNKYTNVKLDKHVVMPNHIHAILVIEKQISNINLSRIVGQYKMSVTKKIHDSNPNIKVWQRSFHDHVIRNQTSYAKIWQYIDNNPLKWEEDCFYC